MALAPKSIIDLDTIRAARGENQQRLANEATAQGLSVLQRMVRSVTDLTGGLQTTVLSDGRVLIPDGSVTVPGLAFLDDTDTGLFRETTGAWGIAQDGVEWVMLGDVLGNNYSAAVDINAAYANSAILGYAALVNVTGSLDVDSGGGFEAHVFSVAPSGITTGVDTANRVSSARFAEPDITAGAGGVSVATTVLIDSVPTEGTSANHALWIAADNASLGFGAGLGGISGGADATITYDGTNLVIDPQVVGSGRVDISGGDLSVDLTQKIYPDGSNLTSYWHSPSGNVQAWVSGGAEIVRMTTNVYAVNNNQGDIDFRVSGDALARLIATDANIAVENIALIAQAMPNWQSMNRGIFVGNSSSGPSGNPTSGAFHWIDSGQPRWRGSGGEMLAAVPSGAIMMWGAAAAPTGWLLCDGSAVSRTTFSDLFAVIGTTYGVGNGSTTFNVPDLRQRFPMGKAASGTGSTLGGTGGTIDHTHGAGSYAAASHSHGDGTLTVASHTHGAGSYAAASHTHDSGTLTVAAHKHQIAGFFTKAVPTGTGQTAVDNQPTDTDNRSPAVDSGDTGSAAPSVSGTSGATTPDVTGSTGSTAPSVSGTSGTANPPFVTVNFIVKT